MNNQGVGIIEVRGLAAAVAAADTATCRTTAPIWCGMKEIKKKPVTHKFLTITGAVRQPQTLTVPLGTPVRELLTLAGGPALPLKEEGELVDVIVIPSPHPALQPIPPRQPGVFPQPSLPATSTWHKRLI
ncbi:SLBB domain-containing protein [Neomoorella mulderi]|uniref:SLBB domain protein n=1 Tax=Moorella mulderi DSM 14980 TaxID=1122241 RepID=A0A151B175_9FIRM|nr:SLBB domain-containing protein [Moorella mulderi]KYH33533.1 SLBB domain protein [Moorella mulderi DSM 14980]